MRQYNIVLENGKLTAKKRISADFNTYCIDEDETLTIPNCQQKVVVDLLILDGVLEVEDGGQMYMLR